MPEALLSGSSKPFLVFSSFAPIPVTNSATSRREISSKSQLRESTQYVEPLKSHSLRPRYQGDQTQNKIRAIGVGEVTMVCDRDS
jgi:hypothetical protein